MDPITKTLIDLEQIADALRELRKHRNGQPSSYCKAAQERIRDHIGHGGLFLSFDEVVMLKEDTSFLFD